MTSVAGMAHYTTICGITSDTFSYTGSDISEAMISAARARHGRKLGLHYVVASAPPEVADYGVASGIFNMSALATRMPNGGNM